MTVAIEIGLALLINVTACVGNLLKWFVLYKKPRFHTKSNLFFMSLGICHVFSAFLVMPFTTVSLMAEKWPFGRVLCDIQGFTFVILTLVSLQTLIIMVASQYFRVSQLAFHEKWFSVNRTFGMIITIWALAVVVMVVPVSFGVVTFQFNPQKSICSIPLSYENQLENVTYTVITTILYITLLAFTYRAWFIYRKQNASILTSFQLQRRSFTNMRIIAGERKSNQVSFVFITEGLLLWLPVVVIKMLEFPLPSTVITLPSQVHQASTFLWFAVSSVHPITYCVLYRPFSREVRRILAVSSRFHQNKVHAEQVM